MYTQRTKTRAKTLSVSQISGVSREETTASISASPLAVHFNWLHAQTPTPPSSMKPCKRRARGRAAPSRKIQRSLDVSSSVALASLPFPNAWKPTRIFYATSFNQRWLKAKSAAVASFYWMHQRKEGKSTGNCAQRCCWEQGLAV